MTLAEEERELALLEAERLMELGRIEFAESYFEEACRHFQEARLLFVKHGDREGESASLSAMGTSFRRLGAHAPAIRVYTQGLVIAREVGNKRLESMFLGNLGEIYREQGEHDRTIDLFNQAIEIQREIGDKVHEGTALGNLGAVYAARGQLDLAEKIMSQALEIHRDVGDKRSAAVVLGNLGKISCIQGQLDRSIELYSEAITSFREVGDRCNEGIYLGNFGDTLCKLDRFAEAEDAFRRAIENCDDSFTVAAGVFRGSLALLLGNQGKVEEAEELLEIGEALVESHPDEHSKFLCKKGQVCHLSGDGPGAQAALKQAQGIAEALKFGDDCEVGQAVARLEAVLQGQDGGAQ